MRKEIQLSDSKEVQTDKWAIKSSPGAGLQVSKGLPRALAESQRVFMAKGSNLQCSGPDNQQNHLHNLNPDQQSVLPRDTGG